jgi:hypothetical protein
MRHPLFIPLDVAAWVGIVGSSMHAFPQEASGVATLLGGAYYAIMIVDYFLKRSKTHDK